jgi:hypothetical protein
MKYSFLIAVVIVILIGVWKYFNTNPLGERIEVSSMTIVDASEKMHGSMLAVLNGNIVAWVVADEELEQNHINFVVVMRQALKGAKSWELDPAPSKECHFYRNGKLYYAKVAMPAANATMVTCELNVQFFQNGKSVIRPMIYAEPAKLK